MARPRKKRQGKAQRAAPPRLLGKRLILNKPVPLGGGLVGTLFDHTSAGRLAYSVEVMLRTAGAPDLRVVSMFYGFRESPDIAVRDTERLLTRLASALRIAGAS